MFWPCETRTSTCRSFTTISSGLYRFLAIAVLLDHTVAHTVARHLAGITGTNRCDRAFNRQEHLCPAPQSRDWSAPHSWCFWVSPPCPRSRRLRAPPPSRGNKHSTTHAGPATRPRKVTIAWVRTCTILSEGKPVPSRTTAIPAP